MRAALALGSMVMLLAAAGSAAAAEPDPNLAGMLPTGADGRALNLDFETGDLRDWTATGEAFAGQPIKGDTVAARRKDMKSGHQGQYWVGSFEVGQDKPTGTLVSAPFAVTQPWASFLVAGGTDNKTRVELVAREDGKPFFSISGTEKEDLARAVVDLRKMQGKEIFVRVVDEGSAGWGHVNFDDFRFHTAEPKFAKELLAGKPKPVIPVDVVKNAGLMAEQAVKEMTLPPGFSATVFAAEPAVSQPVAMTIDARGRVWVAEAHTYPKKAPEGEGKDRIVIFEDADGDGRAEKRTVFIEGLNLVSGMEVGFGGVWVGAAPHLMFIPDKDGDDKPDGPAEVLLDGWAFQDTHETLNAFIWGPDGWLYGCHGVFTHSKVGKPGTPEAERTPINAGVWRYHPTRHVFEVFAHGTSNPWGVDFNDYGHAFATACVIPHLYQIIPGARYQRQAGQHFNPYTYQDIKTIADHVHWAGGGSPHSGNNRSDAAGGGHAHCGAMVYLGGSFPAEYRNAIFMSNIHGNRLNVDWLEARGSGYVGKHGPDVLKMNDKWSRLIAMRYGPGGSVYMIDWYDKQACHLNKPEVWDRSNGRIYKVSYKPGMAGNEQGDVKDLYKLADDRLVQLQGHPNDFLVRHARRILQERQSKGAVPLLKAMLADKSLDVPRHLRALWALHAVGAADADLLLAEMKHADAAVRGWAVQLACEQGEPSAAVLDELVRLAKEDPSAAVRLSLASAAQRLPVERRWDLMKGLIGHAEDAADHNLPCMYWYALEPMVGADKAKGLATAAGGKVPLLRELATRRIGAGVSSGATTAGSKAGEK